MITSKNIGILLNLIKNSNKNSDLYLLVEKNNISNVDFITLTASGGPFLNMPIENFKNIKPSDAINHTVWTMGQKI